MSNKVIRKACETVAWGTVGMDAHQIIERVRLQLCPPSVYGADFDPENGPPDVREAWHIAIRQAGARKEKRRRRHQPGPGGAPRETYAGLSPIRKLLRRLEAVFDWYRREWHDYIRRQSLLGVEPSPRMIHRHFMKRHALRTRGQWHRWYKVNQRYHRQIRALRQLGFKLPDGTVTDISRYMVR